MVRAQRCVRLQGAASAPKTVPVRTCYTGLARGFGYGRECCRTRWWFNGRALMQCRNPLVPSLRVKDAHLRCEERPTATGKWIKALARETSRPVQVRRRRIEGRKCRRGNVAPCSGSAGVRRLWREGVTRRLLEQMLPTNERSTSIAVGVRARYAQHAAPCSACNMMGHMRCKCCQGALCFVCAKRRQPCLRPRISNGFAMVGEGSR